MSEEKPKWWPKNPYPETIFVMKRERYPEIVPDPDLRTGLSGMLGREFWDIASETIWEKVKEHQEQLEAENKGLRAILKREIDDGRAEVDDIGADAWIEQALSGVDNGK